MICNIYKIKIIGIYYCDFNGCLGRRVYMSVLNSNNNILFGNNCVVCDSVCFSIFCLSFY